VAPAAEYLALLKLPWISRCVSQRHHNNVIALNDVEKSIRKPSQDHCADTLASDDICEAFRIAEGEIFRASDGGLEGDPQPWIQRLVVGPLLPILRSSLGQVAQNAP
jgi:hypothetical protein